MGDKMDGHIAAWDDKLGEMYDEKFENADPQEKQKYGRVGFRQKIKNKFEQLKTKYKEGKKNLKTKYNDFITKHFSENFRAKCGGKGYARLD